MHTLLWLFAGIIAIAVGNVIKISLDDPETILTYLATSLQNPGRLPSDIKKWWSSLNCSRNDCKEAYAKFLGGIQNNPSTFWWPIMVVLAVGVLIRFAVGFQRRNQIARFLYSILASPLTRIAASISLLYKTAQSEWLVRVLHPLVHRGWLVTFFVLAFVQLTRPLVRFYSAYFLGYRYTTTYVGSIQPSDVTVILSIAGEVDEQGLTRCIESVYANRPAEIIITVVGPEELGAVRRVIDEPMQIEKNIHAVAVVTRNKYLQFVKAADLASTKIIAYAEENVLWQRGYLAYALRELQDPTVGLVGTSTQSVVDRQCSFVSLWNAFHIEEQNLQNRATYNIDGGVEAIPDHTFLIRNDIYLSIRYGQNKLPDFVRYWNPFRWGSFGLLDSQGDNTLTRHVIASGYKLVFKDGISAENNPLVQHIVKAGPDDDIISAVLRRERANWLHFAILLFSPPLKLWALFTLGDITTSRDGQAKLWPRDAFRSVQRWIFPVRTPNQPIQRGTPTRRLTIAQTSETSQSHQLAQRTPIYPSRRTSAPKQPVQPTWQTQADSQPQMFKRDSYLSQPSTRAGHVAVNKKVYNEEADTNEAIVNELAETIDKANDNLSHKVQELDLAKANGRGAEARILEKQIAHINSFIERNRAAKEVAVVASQYANEAVQFNDEDNLTEAEEAIEEAREHIKTAQQLSKGVDPFTDTIRQASLPNRSRNLTKEISAANLASNPH
ncbi:hypothetical protein B0O99DRAFT_692295 [Bisporella sp. PMI_857]|nr:hypothetical protein B0O99DRAFT_692295 [Bisporella sp. PMI_857]